MRVSNAKLVMKTYARTRQNRLHGLAEAVGDVVTRGAKCVPGVLRVAVGAAG